MATSSSNRVRLSLIEETVYGETPAAGDFDQLSFTSEGLSGTPQTTESQLIRTDRMSSGQVNVGLESGGDIAGEIRKDPLFEKLLESAMLNSWAAALTMNAEYTVVKATKKISRDAGSFITDGVKVGDLLRFGEDFANVGTVKVKAVTALEIDVEGNLVDEAAVTADLIRPEYLDIGATKKSFSVEKAFLDLTNKAIIYPGALVNALNINCTFQQIATWSVSLLSNGYNPVEQAADFITNGRTINAPVSKDSMNSSVDLSLLLLDGVIAPFCLRSIVISLSNNATPVNCIGRLAPKEYNAGEAGISVTKEAYLEDSNWSLLKSKLEQSTLSIDHVIENDGEGYAFSIPAAQVSFPDPSAGGKNQDLLINMSGTAKVGATGQSALRIYRF